MEVINDALLKEEIIADLMEYRNYSQEEAEDWADEHGNKLVSDMWDAYSYYLESFAEYKGEEE